MTLPGQRWSRPAHQARVVLETASATAVGFSLGIVELLPTDQEHTVVGHLGPDLLGPDWDAAEAARRVASDPRPVHVAILDQRNLAGLGNEYANELLFVRGLLPMRPANGLDGLVVAGLVLALAAHEGINGVADPDLLSD